MNPDIYTTKNEHLNSSILHEEYSQNHNNNTQWMGCPKSEKYVHYNNKRLIQNMHVNIIQDMKAIYQGI